MYLRVCDLLLDHGASLSAVDASGKSYTERLPDKLLARLQAAAKRAGLKPQKPSIDPCADEEGPPFGAFTAFQFHGGPSEDE